MILKVIDKTWFSNSTGNVGIVIVEDERTKERRAYIGCADGYDEEHDIERIKDHGNRVRLEMLETMMRLLKK